MSIILGALAGAADQYLKEDGEKRKAEIDRETYRVNSGVDADRQKTLQIAQEQMKNAPLMRYGAAVKRMQEGEVPMEAAPVSQLSGAGTTYDGRPLQTSGFNGDPEKVRQSIIAGKYPPAVEAQMLAQLDSQFKADTKKAEGIVSGQMRKRTTDEAIEAAREDTLVNDPAALAAFESTIGRTMRDERKLSAAERKAEQDAKAKATSEERRAKDSERKDETARYIAELRSADTNKRLDALIANSGGNKSSGTREALSFVDGARKELASEASNLRATYQSEIKDVISPKERERIKAEYAPKFTDIEKKRDRIEADFNALRERVGLPGGAPATPAQPSQAPASAPKAPAIAALPAGAKQIGTSGGKPVYQLPDGRKVVAQ